MDPKCDPLKLLIQGTQFIKKGVAPFIYLFNEYLLSNYYYVRSTVLNEGDTMMSKNKSLSCHAELSLPGESGSNRIVTPHKYSITTFKRAAVENISQRNQGSLPGGSSNGAKIRISVRGREEHVQMPWAERVCGQGRDRRRPLGSEQRGRGGHHDAPLRSTSAVKGFQMQSAAGRALCCRPF